jgi:hypothetical protein
MITPPWPGWPGLKSSCSMRRPRCCHSRPRSSRGGTRASRGLATAASRWPWLPACPRGASPSTTGRCYRTVCFTNAKNIANAIPNNNGKDIFLLGVDKGVASGAGGGSGHGSSICVCNGRSPLGQGSRSCKGSLSKPDASESYIPPNNDNDDMPVSARQKQPQVEESGNNAEHLGRDDQLPDCQKCRCKNWDERALAKEVVDQAEGEVLATKPVVSKTLSTAASDQMRKVVNESSNDEPGLPAKCTPLPITKEGWLVATSKSARHSTGIGTKTSWLTRMYPVPQP